MGTVFINRKGYIYVCLKFRVQEQFEELRNISEESDKKDGCGIVVAWLQEEHVENIMKNCSLLYL